MDIELDALCRAMAEVFGADHVAGRGEARIADLTHDSREVGAGVGYCAVVGARSDGHDHAAAAARAGAPALLVERWLDDVPVAQVRVPDTRRALGPAAAAVHGHPSRDLTVVGVTGTNGKTTTAYLLEGAFAAAGIGTGLIGTVETRIHGRRRPGVRTTPEGSDLQRLLADMRAAGVGAVAMEVSSHGLALHRVDGTAFAVAVFTNLSQDHLDFHADLDDYLAAKARLFARGFAERAVVCVDDDGGRQIARGAAIPVQTFGTTGGDVHLVDVEVGLDGTAGRLVTGDRDWAHDGLRVHTALIGAFNLRNAAGAVLGAIAAGVEPAVAAAGVGAVRRVRGRLEPVDVPAHVFVDYAHTPEAVATVVATVRALMVPGGRLTVVLGAGGDRDRSKRAPMGAAAGAADVVVVTSDNPRNESAERILDDVTAGIGAHADLHREVDRRAAIRWALDGIGADDVVLVLGKGHETTQDLGDRVVEFDDAAVVRECWT